MPGAEEQRGLGCPKAVRASGDEKVVTLEAAGMVRGLPHDEGSRERAPERRARHRVAA